MGGGRDVLIVAPNLSLPHPEAVARRPGQLTEEDKLKLQSQGLPTDCQDELDIVEARYKRDKRTTIVGIKSRLLSREDILQNIEHLLTTTRNDGGINNVYLKVTMFCGYQCLFCGLAQNRNILYSQTLAIDITEHWDLSTLYHFCIQITKLSTRKVCFKPKSQKMYLQIIITIR